MPITKYKKTNNKKRSLITTIFCLSFALLLTLISCKEEEPLPDCGCNSETIKVIPENSKLNGQISFKKHSNSNDTYYTDKYWIGFVEPNCSNCIHHMIVCNENSIPSNIKTLINTNGIVNIKFSGNLKNICNKTFDVADVTYQRIILTKIELQ